MWVPSASKPRLVWFLVEPLQLPDGRINDSCVAMLLNGNECVMAHGSTAWRGAVEVPRPESQLQVVFVLVHATLNLSQQLLRKSLRQQANRGPHKQASCADFVVTPIASWQCSSDVGMLACYRSLTIPTFSFSPNRGAEVCRAARA